MQFNDNSVPGKYQQPIGSFAGRIVSNDVEKVDFIPGANMRIWYNNRSEDYPVHRHSCLEITIPIEKSYTYIFDDRTIILKEKEILFVPPDMLHKIAGTRSGIRFIYLFNIDFLKGFFDYDEFQKLIKSVGLEFIDCRGGYKTEYTVFPDEFQLKDEIEILVRFRLGPDKVRVYDLDLDRMKLSEEYRDW